MINNTKVNLTQHNKNLIFVFLISMHCSMYIRSLSQIWCLTVVGNSARALGEMSLESNSGKALPCSPRSPPLHFYFTATFVFSFQPRRWQQPRLISVCVAASRRILGASLREGYMAHLCCVPINLAVTDAHSPEFLGDGVTLVHEKCRKLSTIFFFPSPRHLVLVLQQK